MSDRVRVMDSKECVAVIGHSTGAWHAGQELAGMYEGAKCNANGGRPQGAPERTLGTKYAADC